MEISFLKTPGQAVTSNRQLNGWAFWVIKYFSKREIKASLTAHWNLTTSKVPRRDPGSLENGSQQSESKKATTTQATMRTLGQPAMEERRHLRFNGWGQRKEKGRKTKWQNWTVHQESSWRDLLAVWIMAHIPLWAPVPCWGWIPSSKCTKDARRNRAAVYHSRQLGPGWGYSSKVKYWRITDLGGNASWVTIFACLFPWSSHCDCLLVLRVS